jgi:hypothetical protein
LQVQSKREANLTGQNKIEIDKKLAAAYIEMDKRQAIINYESGQSSLNTPHQAKYVQDYLTNKGENTEFKDALRREETQKKIAEKTNILDAAALRAGGTAGAVYNRGKSKEAHRPRKRDESQRRERRSHALRRSQARSQVGRRTAGKGVSPARHAWGLVGCVL